MMRAVVLVAVIVAGLGAAREAPIIGAGALLRPSRRTVSVVPPADCLDETIAADGVALAAWRCAADRPRGTVVYLHGIADSRASAVGVIERFRKQGFDVVAYDSRAHGDSGGEVCTYGYYEKRDLHRVLDSMSVRPIVLIGTSLGAAVALQEAADDSRVIAVVAAEPFADLRTVATERAPRWLPAWLIAASFTEAEREGRFRVDDVSPLAVAAHIGVPALIVHGATDVDTVPAHSKRIFARLAGPKELVVVPGAHHNESLNAVWPYVEQWVDAVVTHGSPCVQVTGVRVVCISGAGP